MTIRASLAAVALTTSFAGVAGAQQPPPEGYEPPQEGYEAPPSRARRRRPSSTRRRPATHLRRRARRRRPPATGLGAAGQIAISDDLHVTAIALQPELHGPEHEARRPSCCSRRSTSSWRRTCRSAVSCSSAWSLEQRNGDTSTTTIGLLPRIGYNFPIGPTASIWPRASLAYLHCSYSSTGGAYSTSNYTVSFIAFVPVLFQPAPHFFIGGGPYLSTDLVSKYDSGGARWTRSRRPRSVCCRRSAATSAARSPRGGPARARRRAPPTRARRKTRTGA